MSIIHWNGNELPDIGEEVEFQEASDSWIKVCVIGTDKTDNTVWIKQLKNNKKRFCPVERLRPIQNNYNRII